ncbi:MAG TPA: glutamate synthase, partial [Candidatus Bathyarchaeia archaeon]|nr:glutamate synthase [Candidatus Bathyarchaeia archaeon]
AHQVIRSRKDLTHGMIINRKIEAEGGCGVIGVACSEPIPGRHFLTALVQMKNRGNGKGGGIAALGLSPKHLGVTREILQEDYLIQIAYLDPSARKEVEDTLILPYLRVDSSEWIETSSDYRSIKGLQVKPPSVRRYFCRVKENVLAQFMQKTGLLDSQVAEDEFIYQNSYALNSKFYASLGNKKAFVLSHGKDMMVLKIVGYGDEVIRYYNLEDFPAHVWIGHHRYPTKGKVWHPGGAHPFVGLHEALVHNGDFSNYYSISEYLAQRNIIPLFLTDTEVAVYLFDLWKRVYGYPTEFVIEAMAPTTERDFYMLPEAKKRVYKEIQAAHIHGSPDGPWFFIVGRSENGGTQLELLGITDTSMLRPQVFALQDGEIKIGLIASERQAIDACLRSLAQEDHRFAAKADIYWNARGGSYTDGGAFIFRVNRTNEKPRLNCVDKFEREVSTPTKGSSEEILRGLLNVTQITSLNPNSTIPKSVKELCEDLERQANSSTQEAMRIVSFLTNMLDRLHLAPFAKEGRIRDSIESSLFRILRSFPPITHNHSQSPWALVNSVTKENLQSPRNGQKTLLLDVSDLPAEGDDSASTIIIDSYRKGWKHILSFDWRGQRFCGCGLGPASNGFRIDVFGNPGDYLGSGLDGAEIHVHAAVQDQVAQIMKSGKLVIYGDVGQTFMYAAKGGEVYVLGNAAGRPLINAVGHPRVVINGTCLDYLAESFMAGNPLEGGGFVVVNGIKFSDHGKIIDLETPYPGGNLFSLASGGAIYLRDPFGKVGPDQLNGGHLTTVEKRDLDLLLPYLHENEKYFGIKINDLLKVRESETDASKVYRKVEAVHLKQLTVVN